MNNTDLNFFKKWFDGYVKSFLDCSEEDRKNYDLKIVHTKNVCKNACQIARSISKDENQVRLAESIALFHDIGRFSQYHRYKTFRDADSKNHGLLGAKLLLEQNVLNKLPTDEQELIRNVVKFHNAYALPSGQSKDTIFFLKLIRDADKVDIFRVFIEYYESPQENRASATAFGVPDSPEYSASMLSRMSQQKIASYSQIRTENDFRLMKLSWVYDLHFDESIRMLKERGYINTLIAKLPETEEIRSTMDILRRYIAKRLNTH